MNFIPPGCGCQPGVGVALEGSEGLNPFGLSRFAEFAGRMVSRSRPRRLTIPFPFRGGRT